MFDLIPDMAAKRAELSPERIAFTDPGTGRDWTFAEVNAAADKMANGLERLGLEPGERLVVLSLNCVEFFIMLFACQKSGIVMAPLNWRQPVAELTDVIASVGASAIFYDTENALPGLALAQALNLRRVSMRPTQDAEASFDDWLSLDAPAISSPADAHAPWYLLFTSGTTGLPKAVIQTARMCWANAVNIGQAIDLTSQDTTINFLPLFHTAGLNLYTLPVFLAGGRSIILPRFEPDDIFALVRTGEVTQFFGVPAIFQAFSLHPHVDDVDWSNLKCACGGAPLPEPLIHFFAKRGAGICNGFGMTETGPTAFLMDRANVAEKIGSVGKAQVLTEVRIDGLKDGTPGEGEILLRGPAITPGYFQNQEATAKAFTKQGWLRSGDIARRDADGYYFIVDRIKDMYISGGENVYPAEVERVLSKHPDILEAAVIGIADAKWGEAGKAFLIARPGRQIDLAGLALWCRKRLAAYKVPNEFHLVEDFPRTAAGKIRKPDLRELME